MSKDYEYIEDEFYEDEFNEDIGSSKDAMYEAPKRKRTKAKKGKGKKVALTLLLLGGLVAGSIYGTKAYYSHQETKRTDSLIASYMTDDYVVLPEIITSNRSYDITYADGNKLASRLEDKNVNYININGQFYTKDGIDIAIIPFEVTYVTQIDAIRVNADGQAIYMAPKGYTLNGKTAYKYDKEIITKVVPASEDYSYISFEGAADWNMVNEPQIVSTLPFEVIKNSTLICDVPDGATLDEYNECTGTLDLAPKKR